VLVSRLVVFDGDCVLCDRTVRFITQRSQPATFTFVARQSSAGAAALAPFPQAATVDGVFLIEAGRIYARSDAALRIARSMHAPWPAFAALAGVVPRALRDAVYDAIARNRYRWFGRLTDE
jgi:predicted DCC family thiol-disulfide oxidoreductase YuxK